MKRHISTIASGILLFILILDSKTAISGATDGVDLCIRTLIPSLFPFLVICPMVTAGLSSLSPSILRPLGRFCKIPSGSESLLLIGFTGGYPLGASSIGQAYRSGTLTREDAQRMLGFCSNAGPSFLFGVLGRLFHSPAITWILWGVHLSSALLVAFLLPGESSSASIATGHTTLSLPKALEQSIKTMALICGWVVLFRVLLTFLNRWILWIFPLPMQVLLSGILELSNGCLLLAKIENQGLSFIIASVILALGGLCVAMQTRSVTPGLSLRNYLPGKLLQAGFSFLFCLPFQCLFPADQRYQVSHAAISMVILSILFLLYLLRYTQKRSSNPTAIGV